MVFPFIYIHVSHYVWFREAAVRLTNIYVEKCSLDDLLKPNGDTSIFFSYYVLYLYITIYFSPKLGNQTFSPLLGCLSYTLLEKKSRKLEGIQSEQGKMRMFYRRDKSCVKEAALCLEERRKSLCASLWNAPLTIGSIQGAASRSCMKDVEPRGSDSPNLCLPPPALLNLVKLPCVTALTPKEMEWSFWFKHF